MSRKVGDDAGLVRLSAGERYGVGSREHQRGGGDLGGLKRPRGEKAHEQGCQKDEEDHHCWHSAYAGCRRITLAYKFVGKGIANPQDAMARNLRDMLIEEIEDGD